jgi:hypothetical protein
MPHLHERPHFDVEGSYLTILKGRPVPAQKAEPARFPLMAFVVQDLDSAVARLRAHDVEMPWGIEDGAYSRWVMSHDPAGNLVELVQFQHTTEHDDHHPLNSGCCPTPAAADGYQASA